MPSHGGEVWALDVDAKGTRLAVGAADNELRLFAVDNEGNGEEILSAMGSVRRATNERVATLRYGRTPEGGGVVMCQGAGKVTEVWRVRSEVEAQKRLKRRRKRRREKGRDGGKSGDKEEDGKEGVEVEEENEEEETGLGAVDELELVATIRSKHKISSAALAPPPSSASHRTPTRVVLALANNSLEVWEFSSSTKTKEAEATAVVERIAVVDGLGHRSDIRSLALSSDDALCVSTSNAGVKLWNPRSSRCLRTIGDTGYGLCALFVPGNKHVVIGTKEGRIEIVDVGAGEKVAEVDAHAGPVWSLAALPDGSGFVSGSADKDVKFWEWELVEEDDEEENNNDGAIKKKRLSIGHTKTLTMADDVLCVRISPNGKLLAISLLDSTVRVFFTDTLKFFLSLYGHKLPVLSMDISSDGALLATGSADKNLKIWGLDFGDCHRSLFAHADSVMAVSFVPKTHYVFTTGKDGSVKYWDADKFEELLELKGHHGEIWTLVISSLGDFVITGSHDRGLRRWERTEEPFFVEEEKEKRLESLFVEDLAGEVVRPVTQGVEGGVLGEGEGLRGAPAGRKTLETVSAADAIVDALDLAASEEDRLAEDSGNRLSQTANPLLLGLSPSAYVLSVVGRVRGSDLEQALLMVPFADALRLLKYLEGWLRQGIKVEVLCRVATLLIRVHMQQLMATPAAKSVLTSLSSILRGRVQELKDGMGFNLGAIEHVRRVVAMEKNQSASMAAVAGAGGVGLPPAAAAAAAAILPLKRKKAAAT